MNWPGDAGTKPWEAHNEHHHTTQPHYMGVTSLLKAAPHFTHVRIFRPLRDMVTPLQSATAPAHT